MAVIVLLCIVILLLAVIIAMMATGWPKNERGELERIAGSIRREMAESRGESVRLLHAMRGDLEDSLREVIERQMESFSPPASRSRGSSRRSTASGRSSKAPAVAAVPSEMPAAATVAATVVGFDSFDDDGCADEVSQRQLALFPEPEAQPSQLSPAEEAPAAVSATLPGDEPTLHIPAPDFDDIPPVSALHDSLDVNVLEPVVLHRSSGYDDIPDVD